MPENSSELPPDQLETRPLNRGWQPPGEFRIDYSSFTNAPDQNQNNIQNRERLTDQQTERLINLSRQINRNLIGDRSGSMIDTSRGRDRDRRRHEMNSEMLTETRVEQQWESLFGNWQPENETDLTPYLNFKNKIKTIVKEKKLEAISQETVKKLIKAAETEVPKEPVSESEGVADKSSDEFRISIWGIAEPEAKKLALEFYSLLRGKGTPVENTYNNETAFIETAKAEIQGLQDDVDPRIITSQMSALHCLIYSGGLDDLYRKYKEASAKSGQPFPTDEVEIIDIKSKLAFDFLENVRQKNDEEKWAQIPSGAVTVGMEIEYTSFIENETRTCGIYETLLGEFETMISTADHPVVKEVYEKAKQKVETRLNILKSILKNRNKKYVESGFDVWEPGTKAAIEIGIIDEKSEISANEIATVPAASYRTQLRELVAVSTIGGLRTNWGVHETFGGIELSTDHTEFMDALPIATAAGFVPFEKISDQLKINLDLGYGVVGEKHKKTGYKEGVGSVYFPFHRARDSSDMLVSANKKPKGIELRSLPEYGQKDFSKLVRQVSFEYLFAHSIKSLQKSEDQRTEQDTQLLTAHTELMMDWKQLLETKGIGMPSNDDKWIKGSIFFGEKDMDTLESNGYTVFLSRMIVASQEDPEFSKKTREIIRRYTGKMKKILGEK